MNERIKFLADHGLFDAALKLIGTAEAKWLQQAKDESDKREWSNACNHYFKSLQEEAKKK